MYEFQSIGFYINTLLGNYCIGFLACCCFGFADEDKARDREARSSGRNTPTRRTPRGSRERSGSTADLSDQDAGKFVVSIRHWLDNLYDKYIGNEQ